MMTQVCALGAEGDDRVLPVPKLLYSWGAAGHLRAFIFFGARVPQLRTFLAQHSSFEPVVYRLHVLCTDITEC